MPMIMACMENWQKDDDREEVEAALGNPGFIMRVRIKWNLRRHAKLSGRDLKEAAAETFQCLEDMEGSEIATMLDRAAGGSAGSADACAAAARAVAARHARIGAVAPTANAS